MNKQQIQHIEAWLDERFTIALATDKRMGNKDNSIFLSNNSDCIYYKGACDMLLIMGYDWKRHNGKHKIFKI